MKQKQIRTKQLVRFKQWSNKRYAAFNSLKRAIKICTLAVAYSIVSSPVQGQSKTEAVDTTSIKSMELDEVTVQSTLIDLKAAETGRSIDIIGGAQLQSLPVTSIDELLRYVPGIDAQQRGAFGTQTDFSLRGSNFNQVLVLIDGQKINDPLTAHFNSNIPITTSEIERIEVIHGPASLEYGPDATGGVINIITKTFSKNQHSGLNADGKLLAGQYNQINTGAGIYYGTDKYRVSASGFLNKADGNTVQPGIKAYFDIRDGSLSSQYQINKKWSVAYRYANDYRDFSAKNFYTEYASDSAIERIKRDRHQIQIIHSDEKYSTQILGSFIKSNDYYLFRPHILTGPNDNSSTYSDIKLTQQFIVNDQIKSLFGGSFQERTVESNDRGNHTIKHYGIFYTISYNPISTLFVNGGVREDYDENYGLYLLPQLSASYKINNPLLVRFAWGRSVRGADFTENYSSNNIKTIIPATVPAVGNPNLMPEKSWNTELGFDYRIISGISLSVTAFNRKVTDLIDYVKTPGAEIHIDTLKFNPTGKYWYAQNNSKADYNGLETRIIFSKKINDVIVNFEVGYTYLDFKFDTIKKTKYAVLLPKHLLNTQISLQYKRTQLSIIGLYKVRNELTSSILTYSPATAPEKVYEKLSSDYQVWNTSLDIDIYKHLAFLSFAVYNVFDKKYSDFLGAEMPGRWLAGGIKIKF
jgi:iron complex outermembrane receptor protein